MTVAARTEKDRRAAAARQKAADPIRVIWKPGRGFPLRLSKGAADRLLLPWARMFLWLAALVLRLRNPYHPVQLRGGRSGKRETETRWAAIAAIIEQYQARSILDVGCAEGWFLRKAAEEFNCFALGIDSYDSRVLLGEAARLHDGVDRVAIMKEKLTPDDVRGLPACDVVLCMSVLHWLIRIEGLPFAQDFVRALAGRAQKALVFEIGEADMYAKKFAKLLAPGASGEDFVRYLMTSAGISNIRVVASSPDINNARTRMLFVGEPGRA